MALERAERTPLQAARRLLTSREAFLVLGALAVAFCLFSAFDAIRTRPSDGTVWLLGRPDPGYPADTARGAFDTLSMLNQREWAIRYEEYQLADGRLIPRHIVLSDAPLTLQLFVTDWESAADAP